MGYIIMRMNISITFSIMPAAMTTIPGMWFSDMQKCNNQKGYVQEFPDSLRIELAVPLVADSHDFLFLISELI